jgi:hypothetical protein
MSKNFGSGPDRLWEYKIIYYNPQYHGPGEHYYMATTAESAIDSHAIVAEHHDRVLPVTEVHRFCPFAEKWIDETQESEQLIQKINDRPTDTSTN